MGTAEGCRDAPASNGCSLRTRPAPKSVEAIPTLPKSHGHCADGTRTSEAGSGAASCLCPKANARLVRSSPSYRERDIAHDKPEAMKARFGAGLDPAVAKTACVGRRHSISNATRLDCDETLWPSQAMSFDAFPSRCVADACAVATRLKHMSHPVHRRTGANGCVSSAFVLMMMHIVR